MWNNLTKIFAHMFEAALICEQVKNMYRNNSSGKT